MPKVTSIEPQKNNPKRFNIFLDGKFAFGADEDTVVDFRLITGKEISEDDLQKILFETEVGKLLDRVYRLLSVRMRSEREIRDYFRIKNLELRIKGEQEISDLVTSALIKKLKNKNLINDLWFAKAWAASRIRSKNKGKRALYAELFRKGINKETIEQVLEEEFNKISEEDLAFQALEKKAGVWEGLEKQKFKQKALGFLGRKGFGYETVSSVVEKYLKSE